MKLPSRGYTIIEVLVVISVIGILVSIGIVSWTGYINWSNDRARENDTRQWVTTFELYRSRFTVYPLMPTDSSTPAIACLGAVGSLPTTAATSGGDKCGQYNSAASTAYASTTSALQPEIVRVGNMVKNSYEAAGRGPIFDNVLVGPVLYVTQTGASSPYTISAYFINFFKTSPCPTDFTGPASPADMTSLFPQIKDMKPTSGPGSSANICYLKSTFSYSPS